MAVVKNMMVRVGADFSSLTSQSKLAAVQTQNWANKTTSAFRQVASGSNVLSAAGTRVSRFASVMSVAGKVIAAVAVARRVVQFGQDCISLASDLAEVQNVVDVVFPSMASRVNEFAKSAAASYGLSETMAKKYTGLYGAMAKSFGFTEAAAYDMSTTLTGLAGDVASFYNIGQDEAYTKLKSVFSGETETLKDLGVVMTQSALDAYALANGYGKTTSSMSEMEKVALRYAFVQSQLSAASGDFARTSGSWANQVRLLSLNFQQLKAIIGSGLIAVLTPFLRMLNTALSALVRFGNAVSSVFSSVFGTKKTAISGAVIEDVQDYSTGLDNVAASAGGASAAAKELKRDLMGFDEINKLSDNTSSSGSGGGGVSGGGLSAGSGIGSSLISDAAENTEKFSGTLQKFHDWLSGLDLKPITTAWDRLKESGGELASIIGGGLKWGLENVLAPLGKWTIEEGLPAAINSLATGFQTLSGALVALEKPAKWVWENGIKPFASRIGKGFTGTLTAASDSVSLFGDAFSDLRSMLKGEKSLSDLFDLGDTGGKLVVAGGLAQKVSESLSTLFGLRSNNGLVVPVHFKAETSDAVWKRFKAGWDKGKSRVVSIANNLSNSASALWQKFKTGWGDAKAKAVNIGNNLSSSASDLWQKFKSGWGAASARAVQIGNSLSTSASTLWQNFRSSWGSRAVSIGNSLSSSAATLWANFRNGWGSRAVSIANSLSSSAATLWANFRNGWGSRAVSIANSLSNSASALWQNFKNSWGSRGVSIVNSLTNTASKLWSDFKAGWSGRTLGISLTYNTNVSGVKKAVYKALGLSGWPTIRFAARGGIVSSATLLGNTVVGEAGTEAIVPLENHTEWLDRVADRLSRQLSGGSSGGGQPMVVQVVLQGRVIGQTVVDYINGRTRTDGVSPIIL